MGSPLRTFPSTLAFFIKSVSLWIGLQIPTMVPHDSDYPSEFSSGKNPTSSSPIGVSKSSKIRRTAPRDDSIANFDIFLSNPFLCEISWKFP